MKKFNNMRDLCLYKNNYYILNKKNELEIFDGDNTLKIICLKEEYSHITIDEKKELFYLLSLKERKIYTSKDFSCYNPIKVKLECINEEIKSISFCRRKNRLLIVTKTKIYTLDLSHLTIRKIFEIKEEFVKINDCMAPLNCEENDRELIDAICCDKKIYICYCFGKTYYISELEGDKLKDPVYETCSKVIKMCVIDQQIYLLINCDCDFKLICTDIECETPCPDYCNQGGNIIDSIASMEKCLAQILCSESLKINAAVKKSASINELLCINNSVRDTIYYITVLEFILTEKLKAVTPKDDCCDDCE